MENQYIAMAEEALIHTYNRYPIVLERGEGMYLYDVDGKKYLDFTAGIAVFALGYKNEAYNDALKRQVDLLIHTSNFFYSVPMAEAAEKLKRVSKMAGVFFTNSGTEAIEGALKLARKYAFQKGKKDCYEVIAMEHSFHGRSTGALAVTGTKKYREAFEPLLPGVRFAEFNNLDSVRALVSEKTCAILMEPIQGEGGIYPASQEFMEGVRKLCDQSDILLILDEIQCGMGRTGSMFAHQAYGVQPDVMAAAKALGCGVPVGAFLANEKVKYVLEPGDHGTTYGGNPLAGAAVSKVFDLFEELHVVEHVNQVSPYLEERLDQLKGRYGFIKERRGKGLMQGLELDRPVGDIVKRCIEAGVILISAGSNVIRFVPPLLIEKAHVDEMIGILDRVLSEA